MYAVAIEAVSIISIASTKKPIFSQRVGFSVWIIQANWYIVQRRKQQVMHRLVYWV